MALVPSSLWITIAFALSAQIEQEVEDPRSIDEQQIRVWVPLIGKCGDILYRILFVRVVGLQDNLQYSIEVYEIVGGKSLGDKICMICIGYL